MADTPAAPDAPLVSVLCLTYNHAEWIEQALDSFHAQRTAFAVEVVVSDDCSSDDTLEKIERWQSRVGSTVRVLKSSVNLGVTRNFRRALKACRGKYIAMCEGDDFWRGPQKLQRQVDFLEAHPGYVMTYHDATIVGPFGEQDALQLPRHLQRDATRAELMATRPISTLTVCFRNVLGELPPELDQAPALDLCLWSLLGQHGEGKYLADIEPAGYRVHVGGVFSMQSDRNRHLMTAQSLLCLSRVYARQGNQELSDALLLKALRMASVPLGPRRSLGLLLTAVMRVCTSALRSVHRGLRGSRGEPGPGPKKPGT